VQKYVAPVIFPPSSLYQAAFLESIDEFDRAVMLHP
jgi:hypothetical protein